MNPRAKRDVERVLQIRVSPEPDRGDEGVQDEINQCIRDSAERGPFIVDLLTQAMGKMPGLRMLEVGAFPYAITRYLLTAMPTMDLVTLDHPNLIWIGSPAHPQEQIITFEMPDSGVIQVPNWLLNAERDRFPFEDHSFDAVICTETLEHLLFSPTHLLCEVHRVLRIGGALVFTVPNSLSLKYLVAQLLNRPILHQYVGYGVYGGHRREYSLSEAADLLRGSGFRVMRAFTKNFKRSARGGKAFLSRLLALISDLPLPYLKAKRESIIIVAQATGHLAPYYPSWLYKCMHLSWMRQVCPDLDDPWFAHYVETVVDSSD